jgi:alpha-galactosidase
VLDMSRGQVRNYLFDTISRLLNSANIEFIKWDMNRPLTDVFSNRVSYRNKDGRGAAPNEINPGNLECSASPADPIFQSETSHRYVLGLYALLARVIEAFPHLVIETCSSGGGRFDLGMLYYSAMGVWTSDNTDAVERLRIQHGTSLVYPFRSMGAHVSTVPNHITGNTTRARTRGFVSMTGSFGFELDLRTATEAELVVYGQQVRLFRQIRHIIRHGELYRLWDPARGRPLCGYMFVHHNKEEAVVFAYSVNSDHWSNLAPPLKLQGLDPEACYEVTEPMPNNVSQNSSNLRIVETIPGFQLQYPSVILTGAILMNAGLPVKFYTLDDSLMFLIMRVGVTRGTALKPVEKIEGSKFW